MRIAVDVRSLMDQPTGIGRYTLQLASRLRSQGHALALYAFGGRRPSPWLEALAAGPSTTFLRHPIPMRVVRQMWRRLRAPPLESFIGDVDLALAAETTMPVTRAPIAAVVYDAMWAVHPEWFTTYAREAGRENLCDVDERAVVAIAISKCTERHVAELHPGLATRLRLVTPIADGVTCDRAPSRERTLLFVGSRAPRKGLDVVAEALLRATGAAAGARLIIAGPAGWKDEARNDAVAALAKRGRADILGFVTDERIAQLRARCTVAVVPALIEGFGMPLLEALRAGCPVVASDIDIFREVGGDAFARAPAGDPAAWATALDDLLADDDKLARLSRAALTHASSFTPETQSAQLAVALAGVAR